eukprot:scaffold257203_cov22-Prasinocladus_malaysianus.AAC.1
MNVLKPVPSNATLSFQPLISQTQMLVICQNALVPACCMLVVKGVHRVVAGALCSASRASRGGSGATSAASEWTSAAAPSSHPTQ